MKVVNEEAGFDRRAWLIVTAVLLFGLIVLATTITILSLPGDGWQMIYEQPPLTQFVGDWPTALQEGDIVRAVDGIAINSEIHPYQPLANWQAGVTVPYTIERDGQQRTVNVLLGKLSSRGILRALANTMRGDPSDWSLLIVGLIVFLLRPRSAPAQLLLMAGASLIFVTKIGWAATTISANFAPPMIWYLNFLIDTFWGWIFFPSLILLLMIFPQPLWRPARFRRIYPAMFFIVPMAVAIYTMLTGQEMAANVLLVVEAVLIFVTAITAVFLTFRHGHNLVARAQVSWVAFGIALTIGGRLVVYLLDLNGLLLISDPVASIIFWPISLALPVCLAIAILRFRLFDINIIIRKTLVYTLLTALLALVYFGLVVLLQSTFDALSGQQSPIAIVISTLVIAALFAPLRQRVQNFIDRRFFRKKYDAQQVLAQFAQTARDETDMDTLTAELTHVVQESMQPNRVGVWLRESK